MSAEQLQQMAEAINEKATHIASLEASAVECEQKARAYRADRQSAKEELGEMRKQYSDLRSAVSQELAANTALKMAQQAESAGARMEAIAKTTEDNAARVQSLLEQLEKAKADLEKAAE